MNTKDKTDHVSVDSLKQVIQVHTTLGDLTGMHKTLREATATCVRSSSMNTAIGLVSVLELIESLLSVRCTVEPKPPTAQND